MKLYNLALSPALRSRADPDAAWDKAIAAAERTAGLRVGDEDRSWIEDFRFLINCVAEVPGLTPIGWMTTTMDAKQRLVNRLRIRNLHRQNPEIGAEAIRRPIFVVGLPRTATTLAHNILAVSPHHRGPKLWEMMHTDLRRGTEVEQRRIKAVRRQFNTTRFAPDFDFIHPVDAEKPEESMFLLPQGAYHLLFHAPMPRYRAWLDERDPVEDYRFLKEALQVLQYGRLAGRWVLKYPLDLAHMDTIREVFPDATFVWTHRDPSTVMGSLCSLADLAQSLFVRRVDRDELGGFALDLMAETVERGRGFRQRHRDAVIDVPYHRLASAPERYVPELYERLGTAWTDADAEHLDRAVGRPVRDRKHEYCIGAYGLTEDRIQRAFGDYVRMVTAVNG
ncbi:sulfotransferase family protein [Glycomyces xiaoerkulensis]|uniref:sulfotransferase family protein n=1 Tax=Glycomyces xiaoerkulensis TaxID=2038139 RepID=UPI0012FFE978|nr:sulfotransferase [Glycomyces xiaoerkulensis]